MGSIEKGQVQSNQITEKFIAHLMCFLQHLLLAGGGWGDWEMPGGCTDLVPDGGLDKTASKSFLAQSPINLKEMEN